MTDGQHRASTDIRLSNHVYDILKTWTTWVLPGLAALYSSLAFFWDFPHVEKIVGSIAAVNTFLGLAVQSLSKKYAVVEAEKAAEREAEKAAEEAPIGDIHFVKFGDDPANLVLHMETQEQVESIADKKTVTFKVNVG